MNSSISRRTFIAAVSGGCLALPLSSAASSQDSGDSQAAGSSLPNGFPSHDPAIAREVVGKSHFDRDAIKQMVEARPELAKASWDWGFGDWESALGAASHVGRPDIAEILMAHGARPDIFTFAMLGNLDAVKAIIAANPGIQRTHGPHSITLMSHAKAGKERAAAVVEYLQSLGDADQAPADVPVDPAVRAAMLGGYEYVADAGANGSMRPICEIHDQRGMLMFRHLPEGSSRKLLHQGGALFHFAGALSVRITFDGGTLRIVDGDIDVLAIRSS